jgi:hypothetical protein
METKEEKYTLEEKGRLERKLNKIYEKLLDIEEHFRYVETEKHIKEFEYEIKDKQERLFDIKASRYNSYERKEQQMNYFNERY